jgi:cupin-like protein
MEYPAEIRTTPKVIDVDGNQFKRDFNRVPFLLRHTLCGDPLLSLDALKVLTGKLQAIPGEVYADVDVDRVDQRWDEVSRPTSSPGALVDSIADAKAWVVIRRAEMDPRYGVLLDETVRQIETLLGRNLQNQMRAQNAIVFLSSPRRITTYHIDRECNFILQISGEKTVYVFDQNDRDVLPEEELERFWTVDNNAAVYKPEYQSRAKVFYLRPGDGLHVPVNAPHWVQNGNDISVTLSLNFQFNDELLANQYRANFCLRKLGLKPQPPGKSKGLDRVKSLLMGQLWMLRRPLKALR